MIVLILIYISTLSLFFINIRIGEVREVIGCQFDILFKKWIIMKRYYWISAVSVAYLYVTWHCFNFEPTTPQIAQQPSTKSFFIVSFRMLILLFIVSTIEYQVKFKVNQWKQFKYGQYKLFLLCWEEEVWRCVIY